MIFQFVSGDVRDIKSKKKNGSRILRRNLKTDDFELQSSQMRFKVTELNLASLFQHGSDTCKVGYQKKFSYFSKGGTKTLLHPHVAVFHGCT